MTMTDDRREVHPLGVQPGGPGTARAAINQMIEAGLLDEVMAQADAGELRLTGEGGFPIEVARRLHAEPTQPNLHEVVHRINPAAHIVYVDNDPLVLVHARALLNPVPGSTGSLSYLEADLRDPGAVFSAPQITDTFDLSRPVAVTMIAVLQLFHDDDQVRALIDDYLGRLAPSSFLAISTVTTDNDPDTVKRVVGAANSNGFSLRHRARDEVAALFGDLELVDPGIVAVHRWHPDDREKDIDDKEIGMYGGVAVKR